MPPRHSIECYDDLTAGEASDLLALGVELCDDITLWPTPYPPPRAPLPGDDLARQIEALRAERTNADIRSTATNLGLAARTYIVTLATLSRDTPANTRINMGNACDVLRQIGDVAARPEVGVNDAAADTLNRLERASILVGSTAARQSKAPYVVAGVAAAFAILGAVMLSRRRRTAALGARATIEGIDSDWWRNYRRPDEKLCYRSKTQALQAFRDANRGIIESWGGLDVTSSPSEFDAINHRHSGRLRGKKAITLAQALWASMPNGAPYCLDQIDIEALNDTSPGRIGSGFRLPNWAYDEQARRMEAKHYAPPSRDELEPAPF